MMGNSFGNTQMAQPREWIASVGYPKNTNTPTLVARGFN